MVWTTENIYMNSVSDFCTHEVLSSKCTIIEGEKKAKVYQVDSILNTNNTVIVDILSKYLGHM